MTTVDRIFELMSQNNLTAKEFANKVGISQGNVTDWKTGRAKPSISSLSKIANCFNISIDFLLGKTSEIPNDEMSFEDLKKYYKEKAGILLENKYINKFSELGLSNFEIENLMKIITSEEKKVSENYFELLNSILYVLELNHDKNVLNNTKQLIMDYNQEKLDLLNEEINVYKAETQRQEEKMREDHIDKLHSSVSGKESASLSENLESLLNYMDKNNMDEVVLIPIIGKIAAGQPILAEQYIEGYLPVDPKFYGISTPDDYFYLRISGDSMNQKVQDGDYVLIHKQDYAEDGDIIVAIVNGFNEATIKKYREINKQYIQLEPMSSNPIHEIKTIDLKETNFIIIGKAIGQFGKF